MQIIKDSVGEVFLVDANVTKAGDVIFEGFKLHNFFIGFIVNHQLAIIWQA